MRESTPADAGSPTPVEASVETQQRFHRLRVLIHDDRRRQRLLFVLSLLGLAIVSFMAFLTSQLQHLPLDLLTTRELQELHNTLFLRFMVIVSLFGYMPWAAFTLGGGALLVGMLLGWKESMYLMLVTALQGVTNQLIKRAIGRPCPLNTLVDVFAPVSGNSFPSGHVMFYTVFFGFLFFLAWTRLPRSFWRAVAPTRAKGMSRERCALWLCRLTDL